MPIPHVPLTMPHATYLEIAALVAQNSLDPSTQNGAVVVDRRGLAVGWNRFAPGLSATPERLVDRDVKLRMTTHAEEAAIVAASDCVLDLPESTMYCLWAACTRCARSIIEARIPRLITLRGYYDMSPERWRGDIDAALAMLQEAGVLVEMLSLPLPVNAAMLRFNGQPVADQFPQYK